MPRLLTIILALCLVLAACSGDEAEPEPTPTPVAVETPTATPTPTPTPKPTPTPTPTPTPAPLTAPLTGVEIDDDALFDVPVVAVKIDNDRRARPQVGLADADIVMVEPIEGLTRLVAIFHSSGAGEVGPARSGRRIDPELFGVFDPIFAYSGAAGPNLPTLDAGFPNSVINDRSRAGWRREPSRAAPHNLFIPLETIRTRFPEAEGPGPEPIYAFDEMQPAGGEDTDGFRVDYGSFRTRSGWTWDEDAAGWLRSQNGTPHVAGQADRGSEDTTQIVAANVVVLTVETTGSQVEPIRVLGEGPALLHRGGQVFSGRWSKPTPEDHWVFTTEDGTVLPLAPGSTWFEIHPSRGSYLPGAPAVSDGE